MASFHINGVSKTSSVYEIRVKCIMFSMDLFFQWHDNLQSHMADWI